jgi:predicted dinucleotide-binding enzyme
MRIGLLGWGFIGGKLGAIFARAGHDLVFSYARSNDKRLAREAQGNARAGMAGDAAKDADALLMAVHRPRIDDVLKQTAIGVVLIHEIRGFLREGDRGRRVGIVAPRYLAR